MRMLKNILFVVPGKKNHSPQIMSFVKRLAKGVEELGLRVHNFTVVKSVNPVCFVQQGRALMQAVKTTEADLVVGQFGTYTGLLVALFAPRPKIITFRGSDLNPVPSASALWNLLAHSASQFSSLLVDGIVVVSRGLQDRLFFKLRLVKIIPSPTETELFRPRDTAECRKILGWKYPAASAVFLAGNNALVKGIDLARKVKTELQRRNSKILLYIIEREIPLAELPIILNAADCLLFLSEYEGSPNLIRDACACNLPIVSVAVGDVVEVLAGVKHSKVVPRKVVDIVNAVIEICDQKLRSNGRISVMQYSTLNIASRTVEFYAQVIDDYVNRCKQ